jgi:hypothetical protein
VRLGTGATMIVRVGLAGPAIEGSSVRTGSTPAAVTVPWTSIRDVPTGNGSATTASHRNVVVAPPAMFAIATSTDVSPGLLPERTVAPATEPTTSAEFGSGVAVARTSTSGWPPRFATASVYLTVSPGEARPSPSASSCSASTSVDVRVAGARIPA